MCSQHLSNGKVVTTLSNTVLHPPGVQATTPTMYRVLADKPSMAHSRGLEVEEMVQLQAELGFPAYARYLNTAEPGAGPVTVTLTDESEVAVTLMREGSIEKSCIK